ncbi:MAG TPA: hypothetical protein VH327_03250 [Gammaproteobacteria bacterium]|nr:hypothetical protein [Gammaproteobacteria bacterium]
MQGRPSFHRAIGSSLLGLCLAAAPVWASNESKLWAQLDVPSGGVGTRIALDPATPSNLFLLVPDQGIYGSTDTGGHWSLVRADTTLLDMAMDPQQPQTLYALSNDNAVYKTTDSGAHWQEMDTGVPISTDGGSEGHIVADPVNEGTVYAVSGDSGVYKTTDGGAHWSASNTGIDSHGSTNLLQAGAGIHSIIVDPMNAQVLYLSAWSAKDVTTGLPGLGIAGIYQSTDGGAHWSQILSGESFWSVGIEPGNDQQLFASGTFHYETSIDGGASWNVGSASGPAFSKVFSFDPTNPQHMWVGGMGFEYSTDGGITWLAPNGDNGTGAGVTDLAVDSTGTKLYAAYSGMGASLSTDGGSSWSPLNTGIDDVKISQLMVGDDGSIYMGTSTSGMFRSSDAGADWAAINNGSEDDGDSDIKQMVEDPTTSTLFAVNGVLLTSKDRGDNWTRTTSSRGDYLALAVTPGHPSTVYVAQLGGVQKSTDDGASWHYIDAGLPAIGADSVESLASSPTDANMAFAGTYKNGLYMTSDGTRWSHVSGLDANDIPALAVDPADADTVYAAVEGAGISKSTDGGASWSASGTGLDDDSIVLITIDPADSDVLVAMSQTPGRVYLSADAGATWTALDTSSAVAKSFVITRAVSSSDPQGPSLAALAMDPKHKGMMYAADQKGNMYKVSVAQLVTGLNKSPASSSSGGGAFPLLASLLLLGFAALRRRR